MASIVAFCYTSWVSEWVSESVSQSVNQSVTQLTRQYLKWYNFGCFVRLANNDTKMWNEVVFSSLRRTAAFACREIQITKWTSKELMSRRNSKEIPPKYKSLPLSIRQRVRLPHIVTKSYMCVCLYVCTWACIMQVCIKSNPITGLDRPWVFQEVEAPKFQDNRHMKPYAPAAFTPRKYSWYSFVLEAESTPGPECGRQDCVNEEFQWHHRESNPRPSEL